MDERSPTWLDRIEEIALPLYGFAFGSVVAGIHPLLVLVAILWWDARLAADAPIAVARVWWTALLIPIGPLAVAPAAWQAARSLRRPWYGRGGALVAIGIAASRWTVRAGPSLGAVTTALAGALVAAALGPPATSLLGRLTGRLATTIARPLIRGTRCTPLPLHNDDIDSFP